MKVLDILVVISIIYCSVLFYMFVININFDYPCDVPRQCDLNVPGVVIHQENLWWVILAMIPGFWVLHIWMQQFIGTPAY